MGIFSKMENRVEDAVEGTADRLVNAPISPVQIAKKCEKQMKRSKMVGAGKQYAPTLYTILVNVQDDMHFVGYYPTLAGETETYLTARAQDLGYTMDGKPLVRFLTDSNLKSGKFDVIAECVAAPIIERLREEEMMHYGISKRGGSGVNAAPGMAPIAAGNLGGAAAGAGFVAAGAAAGMDNGYDDGFEPYEDDYEDDFPVFDEVETDDPFAPKTAAPAAPAAAVAAAAAVPSPMAAHAATLRDLTSGRTYKLSASSIKIGRETDNDIEVADMGASRNHCVIVSNQSGWVVNDCNSLNGTFVNGREINSKELSNGDVITIGTTRFEFIDK